MVLKPKLSQENSRERRRMRHFPLIDMRIRLILIVLLVFLPMFGLTLFVSSDQRSLATNQAKANAAYITEMAASDHTELISGGQQLLVALAEIPQVTEGDPAECSALLSKLVERYPAYDNLGVVTPEGNLKCSAVPSNEPVSFADRKWFQLTLQTHGFVVGEYVVGRVTGTALLPIAYPVLDNSGKVQLVLFAGISLDWVYQFIPSSQFPAGTTITILDRYGTILARHPSPERWVGKTIPESPIAQAMLSQHEGTIEATGVDGVQRLYAFTSLGETGSENGFISVGFPTATLYTNVERLSVNTLATLGVITVLALGLSWFGTTFLVARPMKRLTQATKRLAKGDLSARTGVTYTSDEFSQLSYAFDQMAGSLQRREMELRESEERFKEAFDNAPIGLALVSPDGRWLKTNRSLREMIGYTENELLSMTFQDITYPDDLSSDLELVRRILTGEIQTYQMEKRYFHKNGNSVWANLSVSLLRDVSGQPIYFISQIENITDRKHAQSQNERLLNAIEASLNEIYMFDPHTLKFVYANAGALTNLGYTMDQIRTMTPVDLKPEFTEASFQLLIEPLLQREKEILIFETVHQRADASLYPVEVHLQIVQNGEGSVFLAVILDITERKQTEDTLRKNERLFRLIATSSPDIIFSQDRNLVYNWIINPADPLSLDQVIGKTDWDLLPPDDAKWLTDIKENILKTGKSIRQEILLSPGGTARWYDAIYQPSYDESMEVVGIICYARDITERKQASKDLEKKANELETLYRTSLEINAQTDLDALLASIVQRAVELVGVDSGALYLMQADGQTLELVIGYNWPEKFTGIRLDLGEALSRKVAQSGETLVVEDYSIWEHRLQAFDDIPLRRTLGVPLLVKSKVIGAINISDHNKPGSFSNEEIRLASLFAAQAAIAIENAHLLDDAQRRLRQTAALREIDQAIAGSMHLKLVLETALGRAISELEVDAAVILLYDPDEHVLKYETGKGFRSNALRFTNLRLGEGYAGMAALTQQTVQISSLQERTTDFLRSPSFHQEGFVCYFGVPLIAKGEVKGVLEIFHRSALKPDKEWLGFMETLAGQVAIAIDNATLYKDLQRSNIELSMAYEATIEGWSRALDLRDKETKGHTQRVTELTVQVAEMMGIKDKELIHIRYGALLHDIGKMGIPDRILLKPDKLTDEEWVLMRRHPVLAYEMLKPIKYLEPALDIPYCHHEKWDGAGYPRGLKGEGIPLAARIFAVIDVYDALTSDRPYRPAWTKEAALKYIREQAGSHFDPGVVDSFLSLMVSS